MSASRTTSRPCQRQRRARTYAGPLDITGTDASGVEYRALIFFHPGLSEPINGEETYIASASGMASVGTFTGVKLDPARGHVVIAAVGCNDRFAAGVTFALEPSDPTAKSYYVKGDVPLASQTTTDASGLGGFMNVAPGAVNVSGNVLGLPQSIAKVRLFVRQGTVTYSRLRAGAP